MISTLDFICTFVDVCAAPQKRKEERKYRVGRWGGGERTTRIRRVAREGYAQVYGCFLKRLQNLQSTLDLNV